jgi:hypothetical protein
MSGMERLLPAFERLDVDPQSTVAPNAVVNDPSELEKIPRHNLFCRWPSPFVREIFFFPVF